MLGYIAESLQAAPASFCEAAEGGYRQAGAWERDGSIGGDHVVVQSAVYSNMNRDRSGHSTKYADDVASNKPWKTNVHSQAREFFWASGTPSNPSSN